MVETGFVIKGKGSGTLSKGLVEEENREVLGKWWLVGLTRKVFRTIQ